MRIDLEKRKVWRDPYENAKKLGRPISPKTTISSKQHKYSLIHRTIGVVLCSGIAVYIYINFFFLNFYFCHIYAIILLKIFLL